MKCPFGIDCGISFYWPFAALKTRVAKWSPVCDLGGCEFVAEMTGRRCLGRDELSRNKFLEGMCNERRCDPFVILDRVINDRFLIYAKPRNRTSMSSCRGDTREHEGLKIETYINHDD